MASKKNIPCSSCSFWKREAKNFSCNPSQCKILSEWLLNAKDRIEFEVRQREINYVV